MLAFAMTGKATNRAIESAGRRSADPSRRYRKLGEQHSGRCVLYTDNKWVGPQTLSRPDPSILRGQANNGVVLAREGVRISVDAR